MELILDASVTLAWLVDRVEAAEAQLANEVLKTLQSGNAVVPALWFADVANGVLAAEQRAGVGSSASASFLGLVKALPIVEDRKGGLGAQGKVMALARAFGLTGHDAIYLELVLRVGGPLATFDGNVAAAVREAGGRVFGEWP